MNPDWFTILRGEHQGKRHLRGWMLTAIQTEGTGPRDDGWLSIAVCPRCFVLVLSDAEHVFGDSTWAHEQWHAATDYPDPAA